jgi:hypothetical protein
MPRKLSSPFCGERVQHVVAAGERRAEAEPLLPLPPGREGGGVGRVLDVGGEDIVLAVEAEGDPAAAGAVAEAADVLVVAVRDDDVARLDLLHCLAEGGDDRVEVGVDVGVVELDVVHEERVRVVVEELRALVEERRVVLVAFDHEIGAGSELEVLIEVQRDAADDHARIAAGRLEEPRHQRGRRRLAVRAGDDDRVLPADEEVVDRLGHGGVRQVELQGRGRLGVRARRDVADDHEVGPKRLQVLLRIALQHGDAEALQVIGHRRIDVLVGAADFVAALLEHAGQRGHRRPGDSDQIDAVDSGQFFDVRHRRALRARTVLFRQSL